MVDFLHMDEPKISRKDFIALVAGVIGVAVLTKFVSLDRAVKTISRTADSAGTYGGSSYGGGQK